MLREVGEELGLEQAEAMAATMTAELSDAFACKRDGVLTVLDALGQAFPQKPIHLLDLSGDLVALSEARQRPLDFAASNWLASALFTARQYPECILMDVGSTTTDIIPIQAGRVVCKGRTDMARLICGELVYTGTLRTNPNTLTSSVPIAGQMCRVSAEYFTVMGDVYLLLGHLSPEAYTCPTPDGRAKSPQAARERLARLVCADGDMLSEEQTLNLAHYLFEKQLQQVSEAVLQVVSRLDNGFGLPLAAAGGGSFLVSELGRRLGMMVIDPGKTWWKEAVAALPSLSVAYLLAQRFGVQKQ